jgi:YidC/Oxa1 family membrane protein insertase
MLCVAIAFPFLSTIGSEPVPQNVETVETKTEQVDATVDESKTNVAPIVADSSALFFASKQPNYQEAVILDNGKVQLIIDPKGGMIARANLPEYRSYEHYKAGEDAPLFLFDETNSEMNFSFETKEDILSLKDYYFVAENQTDTCVTMVLSHPSGEKIMLDYALLPDNYLVNFTIRTENMQKHFTRNSDIQIDWKDCVKQQEKGYYFENMYSTLTYKLTNDDTDNLAEMEDEQEKLQQPVDWIAFKNQYFSAVMIAKESFTNVDVKSQQMAEYSGYLKGYTAKMNLPFDASAEEVANLQFYFGPNHYRTLQKMDDFRLSERENDLQELVDLGWPLFRWINRFFTIYVFDYLTAMNLPMWVVLLLITLLMRVIVYPTTKKSYLSGARMRVLRPKLDVINAKYPNKEDAMKRQTETMQLYSQYGVSPMGGCLPMLIQMPLWIAMFNFIPNAIELRQQSFLWADDLSAYDDVINWGTEIWGLGNHLSLFCLLFCGAQILYTWMTMRQQRDTMTPEQAEQMKIMNWMMYLMPLMFFFMFNKYSSGLNYYYFISLFISALTMWWLRKTTDDKKLLEQLEKRYEENKKNPKKKSGLAARLEAMQKQQEELLKRQQEIKQKRGM